MGVPAPVPVPESFVEPEKASVVAFSAADLGLAESGDRIRSGRAVLAGSTST